MRIGYACINTRLNCRASRTLRLASFAPDRFREVLGANLECLRQVLAFNLESGLLLFRVSSDLVPFASHEVCDVPWQTEFAAQFREIGGFASQNGIRLAMHPDQFTLINALDNGIVARSVAELQYHADALDALGVDDTNRIQIHVGGLYGDKEASLRRFMERYQLLPERVRARLAIENDDHLFDLSDCLAIHGETGVPVVFDSLHHELNNDGTTLREGIARALGTWSGGQGRLMVDYSAQDPGKRRGCHAESIETGAFRRFLEKTAGLDFDVLCEVKDKESSALKALAAARQMGRA